MDIYGTIGPACRSEEVLEQMFRNGMTGVRLNLSHVTLEGAAEQIGAYHAAARKAGVTGEKLLIDMQGPELRLGRLDEPVMLAEGQICENLPIPEFLKKQLKPGMKLLMDDGKILAEVYLNPGIDHVEADCKEDFSVSGSGICNLGLRILRGGLLQSGKSIAVEGMSVQGPAVTLQDRENLRRAKEFGVTGVMQPFVRSSEDLKEVRKAMDRAGCGDIALLAKVENMAGVANLESFFPYADEIVIARGDLGNAMPLWELPRVQKEIEARCRAAEMPFMVVTQMLASMEHSAVPTRAEVSDIYNAVIDGASSVMVTGETAVGQYPAEVIRYLANTAREAQRAAARTPGRS